jgi:hypothetical protein
LLVLARIVDLYLGLFLVFASTAFFVQSDNMLVILMSSITFIAASTLIDRCAIHFPRIALA